jgi:hypothetical protein
MQNWFDLNEEQKVKEVYSKYSIADFWNWWTDGDDQVMEVRIKDYPRLKDFALKNKLPFSLSGIYVSNVEELKLVIKNFRDDTTLWFGVNPRKKAYHKNMKVYGGKDVNVHFVNFIFIDIDRKNKDGPATAKDLEVAYYLAQDILKNLGSMGFDRNYIMIGSGHGVQLLIKLDYPIVPSDLEYDSNTNYHKITDEFVEIQNMIRKGIGADIVKWSNNIDSSRLVEIDTTGFNIGRVAALPYTKNFKYDGHRWRGILEIKNGVNEGFTDYIISRFKSIKLVKEKRLFKPILKHKYRLSSSLLEENKLVRFMLDKQLPYGEINNKLWFQFKCLARDSGINFNDPNLIKIKKKLDEKYRGNFTLNIPDKRFKFDENIVNKYCINNLYPPLYDLWPKRTYKHNYLFEDFNLDHCKRFTDLMKLPKDTTILEDMNLLKEELVDGDFDNIDKFAHFHNAVKAKYGNEKAEYYYKYIYNKYISYD